MSRQIATIIGGHGFVGSALARHLSAAGWDCRLPGRDTAWPMKDQPLGHVFYCAGLTGDYLQRAPDTVEAHVSLLVRVLQSSTWDSLVYLSSTRLYDGLSAGVRAEETTLLPVAPQVPRHLFDLTKLTGESLCHVLGQGRARVARLASVYDSLHDANGFLPALLRQVAQAPRGATVTVDSSPQVARDYIHLPDVLRALVDIAQRGTQSVYNVATGENVCNDELAQLVGRLAGRALAFRSDQVPAAPAVVDISRLQHEFGWRPARVETVIGPWLRDMAQAS
ncbi:NAD(P)-dependent oxidoreductase [Curvibacter sp. PAE-UM]|uniref:NAD-dependent epimerase/dehydratase family protein n=1 Tax=Curvibacter sp. PAE-UM TaxID=1714344 RepID=UPI0009E74CF1|nr:NAD(P)-dependent oxidoreductase [Curvibacter sp. PAE-UM]